MEEILSQFDLRLDDFDTRPFGHGLINTTWVLQGKGGVQRFILQKINKAVFTKPEDIACNTSLLAAHLRIHFPGYLFVAPLNSNNGTGLAVVDGSYYRVFPFIKESHTIDVVQKPEQAYEAAKQFGSFTKNLAGFEVAQLKITLPDFHNLSLRYRQFETSLKNGNKDRIKGSKPLIDLVKQHKIIVDEYENFRPSLKLRVTHHDTKISNVLFGADGKGLCVIDLDTVMPGYFISDVGDMMRTYLCPVSEEEHDLSKIQVRPAFYNAVVSGYLSAMEGELTATEKKYFHFAGQFMIYMQAIRFLTDHINNDVYYGSKYEGHNFVRASNQLRLLQELLRFNYG